MTTPRGVPPGRAGRSWLAGRLRTAERAARLLDRKLTFLREEQRQWRAVAEETGAVWRQRCAEAETWLVRGVVLGGERGLRLAVPADPAQVEVTWAAAMGLRYPAEATCVLPEPSPGTTAGSAALRDAAEAHRSALEAAVRHAVAEGALRALDAEISVTGRRRRAIEDRWLPRLTAALRDTELAMDELERSDAVRRRWAAGRD